MGKLNRFIDFSTLSLKSLKDGKELYPYEGIRLHDENELKLDIFLKRRHHVTIQFSAQLKDTEKDNNIGLFFHMTTQGELNVKIICGNSINSFMLRGDYGIYIQVPRSAQKIQIEFIGNIDTQVKLYRI